MCIFQTCISYTSVCSGTCRQAGLELLLSLVNRVGKQKVSAPDPDNQMLMESILPYKEKITGLARQSLSDNESQVTAVASKVTMAMSWWP
jgi:hypothetical protein